MFDEGAEPLHICFDLDGTLWETGEDCEMDDGDSILRHTRPIHRALKRLEKFLDAGGRVSFVTGRHKKVEWATFKQLRTALGDRAVRGVEIHHRDFEPYELMACVVYKFDALRYIAPDIYVGDLPMDQTAAAASGVAFMPAEWWAKGHEIAQLTNADFSPPSLREKSRQWNVPAVGLTVRNLATISARSIEAQNLAPAIGVDTAHPEGKA